MIIAIVGPTGTGKTELSLAVAARLGAEIVNVDSRQVYRGLDIGSAKPSPAQRAAVPHHLFDVVEPDARFDCARYRELAGAAIAEIRRRGRPVLLVGGTGLYLKVLRYGLCPAPPHDAVLRAELEAIEESRPGTLHERLRSVDAATAARLHPHDRVRLVRAVEVQQLSGRPLSDWQAEHGFRVEELPVRTVALELDRPALHARIEERCRGMVAQGLVEEVAELWRRGYGPELAALRSIGYRQLGDYLLGRCDLEHAVADMARATRQLAKRQLTWFRADPTLCWIDAAAAGVERVLDAASRAY